MSKQNSNDNQDTNVQQKKKNIDENIGLEFKSKPFRKWMKEYFQRNDKNFGFKNAHYILSIVDQILTFNVLNGMSESFKKTNHGFYDVKLDDFINYIKLTPYLLHTFNFIISRYDDNIDYVKQLSIDKKAYDKYIIKCVFNDNFRINLNNQSMNFLTYLLVQTNILLSNTAMHIVMFANKKSITDNAIIHALKIHFSGKLLDDILKKCDSVITLLKNKDKEDSEKGKPENLENTQNTHNTQKNKDEKSEDEKSEDEKSEDEKSEDEKSEDEKSEDEKSEDEKSEDEKSELESESEDDKKLSKDKSSKKSQNTPKKVVKKSVQKKKN
jgi:hypothetical protein